MGRDLGPVRFHFVMAESAKTVLTAAEMGRMSPQQRVDVTTAATARSRDEVPDQFRSEVLETSRTLGEPRRAHG